jgi:hypothetical protein
MPEPELTPQLQDTIVAAIRRGSFDYIAAGAAGVRERTFRRWMSAADNGDPLYAPFADAVCQARDEARNLAESRVFESSPLAWLRYGPGRERAARAGWTNPPKPEPDPPEDKQVIFHVIYGDDHPPAAAADVTHLDDGHIDDAPAPSADATWIDADDIDNAPALPAAAPRMDDGDRADPDPPAHAAPTHDEHIDEPPIHLSTPDSRKRTTYGDPFIHFSTSDPWKLTTYDDPPIHFSTPRLGKLTTSDDPPIHLSTPRSCSVSPYGQAPDPSAEAPPMHE